MEFKESQTFKNLQEAFCGESKARNMYTYFASGARKDGFEEIARIFEETANNEKEHAKIWFKFLNDGEIKNTKTNLETSIASEHYEWTTMYKNFAITAKEEGFDEIANAFELVATVEKFHNRRYDEILNKFNSNNIFEKENEVFWECANCGFHFKGKNAPEICPLCKHPKSYFFERKEFVCF